MKRLYIWGAVAWATGWLFLPPNADPSPSTFWWLAAIGTLFILIASGFDSSEPRRWPFRSLAAGAALAIFAIWWFELPAIGALLLAGAVVLATTVGGTRWGAKLGDGLLVAGTVALLQLVGYYLYIVYLGPRGHGCAIPATIIAAALRLFGVHAVAMSDGLHLLAIDRLYEVVPSPVNMGLFVFLMVWMGLIALAITGKVRPRAVLIGGLGIGLFALLRYAAVAIWDYNQGGTADIFWSPRVFAWTAWPVAFLMQGLATRRQTETPKPVRSQPERSGRRLAVVVVATALAVLAWTFYESYHPAGVRKQGRMLIDELHSDWEWTEMPFDTVWYGQQSTYNFYLLAEYWGKHFQMERSFDSLTPERLADVDILVLKVPTQPYAEKEIDAVYDWVKKGGGLILIGEHTNVFGYGTFLNPVAGRFGIRFIPDIVYELKTGDLNLEHMPSLLPHPVRANMPPDFLFGGPCSIWADLSARSIITGMQLKTLPADYTQRNFFPERSGHTGYRFGQFLLSLSTRCGKGRIVTFPDSTLWSNFFVFIPGKPELALMLAEYVNRYDPFPYWRIVTFLFAVVAFLVAIVAAAGLGKEGWAWLAAVGCIVFGLTARWVESINQGNYTLPKPHSPFAQLNFEAEHSRFFLPELRLAREPDKDFSTFYLWASRVGVVPRKWPTLKDALAQPGGQIIIDPVIPFSSAALERLREFVTGGGTLYVFDDPTNHASTSAPLLSQFGLTVDLRPVPSQGRVYMPAEASLWQGGGRITGGEPLVTLPDGSVSCAIAHVGQGKVIAYANSHAFERKTMGYTAMIPNPIQNAISQFEYRLMTYLDAPPVGAQPLPVTRRRAGAVPLGD
ncbi:MAG: hypothetical protein AB1792_10975 [Candidatus Zixiibacteriota bacterium]